ncbi:OmpA family protein [Falsiroseomonas sp.]|uniref:OmpA family protein n=1 Tax=Falsiroseomonas sp. TaxID=2870721 RepID=UPI0035626FF1
MIRRRSLVALPLSALAVPVRAGGPLAVLPRGGWRLVFPRGETRLPPGAEAALAELARELARQPAGSGRITVEGQASGPANDASAARRLSLARANAVRAALAEAGLASTRVDVRPLGRTEAALDAADILPPEAPRSGQSR